MSGRSRWPVARYEHWRETRYPVDLSGARTLRLPRQMKQVGVKNTPWDSMDSVARDVAVNSFEVPGDFWTSQGWSRPIREGPHSKPDWPGLVVRDPDAIERVYAHHVIDYARTQGLKVWSADTDLIFSREPRGQFRFPHDHDLREQTYQFMNDNVSGNADLPCRGGRAMLLLELGKKLDVDTTEHLLTLRESGYEPPIRDRLTPTDVRFVFREGKEIYAAFPQRRFSRAFHHAVFGEAARHPEVHPRGLVPIETLAALHKEGIQPLSSLFDPTVVDGAEGTTGLIGVAHDEAHQVHNWSMDPLIWGGLIGYLPGSIFLLNI
jgi:hypothetical protein